jgi:predicted RND superfamily exporter protein
MGLVQRRILNLVLRVVSYPRTTLVIAGGMLGVCIVLSVLRLGLSTDQNKLFSPKVKFFRDFLEFVEQFPENEAIYIILEAKNARKMPPTQRWIEAAEHIGEKLRGQSEHVRSVETKISLEELGAQGILYEEPKSLRLHFEETRRMVPLAQLWVEQQSLTALLGRTAIARFLSGLAIQKPDAENAQFAQLLAESWTEALGRERPPRIGDGIPDLEKLGASDPSRLGYSFVEDESDTEHPRGQKRRILLISVAEKHESGTLTAISRTVDAIRATAQKAAEAYPEFTVGVTGRPALEADEMRTTDHDTHVSEAVALSAVFAALVLMLRSVWLALVAELSLAVGIGWTFGWATISVGELNLLSIVFVVALIGIGMDYLIQILTRYRREARRYVRPRAVWARVFRYVSPPILTACLGAAGAFFVAIFTDFRGAAELGIIAGGGLLLCLLAGYTVLPAILVLFPPKLKPARRRYHAPPAPRRASLRLLPPALWVLGLAIGVRYTLRAEFDPNLLNLQAPNLASVKLIRKVQTWSAVVLSSDLEMLRKVKDSLRDARTIGRTESILDASDNYAFLKEHQAEMGSIRWTEPAPIQAGELEAITGQSVAAARNFLAGATVADKNEAGAMTKCAEALGRFAKRLTDAPPAQREQYAARLSQWQSGFMEELKQILSRFAPIAPDIQKLPAQMKYHYISTRGNYALYIYPEQDLWKRENLTAFVRDVEAHVAKVPGAPSVTGIASNIFHSTRSIEKSFYSATAYAFGLIFLLVLIDLRSLRQTLLAVSVLALGLPMLVSIMGWQGIPWNFANFFALPILLGAGHEYGVFMMHRYREVLHNPRRVWRAWDVSDRALLLCAFVTSSSFGFFWWLGHHRGLRSLGFVMAVGTACIYLATIMVVRPLLRWMIEKQDVYARVKK